MSRTLQLMALLAIVALLLVWDLLKCGDGSTVVIRTPTPTPTRAAAELGVFVTMLHPHKRRPVCAMLESLHRTLNRHGRYRHVLLTERPMASAERAALQACVRVQLVFANVTLPSRPADLPFPQRAHCAQFPDGYRRMCRYLARDVALHPALAGAEYVARVDDDSHFWTWPNGTGGGMDVFERMRAAGADYGYRLVGWDGCQQQLAPLARAYAQEWEVLPPMAWRDGVDLDRQLVFYNNFFVARRAAFADPRYANFIHYLDALGGFWTRRWGDHAVQTAAAALFNWNVVRITSFGYRHQGATADPGSFKERPTPGYHPNMND